MRLFLVAVLTSTLAGCSKGDELKSAALKVQLHYEGFRPGCVTLTVTDQADVSRHVTKDVNVSAGAPPGTLSVAVFRQAGWSNDVKLLAQAHEQSCEGARVAIAETTASLAKDGITPVELLLAATDGDGDGYVVSSEGGTDCNDRDETVGGPKPWYADDDGDGYGNGLLPPRVVACEGPALTASRTGDCNDRDLNVHPDQAELRCDGKDDNCDGAVDESFDVGGMCRDALDCEGVTSCAGCSNTAMPTPYYVDTDGDGKAGTPAGPKCGAIPASASREPSDCDESSIFRATGLPEVCDRIDNDCSGGPDNGVACSMDWQTHPAPDTTAWKAVATDGTTTIWVAGDGDKLALSKMDFTGGKYVTCDGDWKAAWVAASGEVFLAGGKGGSGRFARALPDATACTTETNNVTQVMNGLVGIENPTGAPTLYGVTGGGRTFRWTPPAAPEQTQPNPVDANLRAISAAGRVETLLAVGSRNSKPVAFRFDAASSTWSEEAIPTTLTGELRGVHVVNANYAYAVGDNGMAFERVNGVWSAMKAVPASYSNRSLQDVVAFGKTAVYVATTDAGSNGGAVLFFDGTDWSAVYTDAGSPARALRSLDGKTPTGVVTTGDRGAAASFVKAR
ncbi:putative metal-binding motif-containing protein [Corallococcus exiguus]|uniref:putative metal-binding motif-containing protein n=1 Tax=Corallococcus exiguus TaxID=83462 RepID=UPI001A8F0846|nr:putative metal-binding motif-containing protein [Corallococcus exiguus]MBN8468068.1 putative metal-binding motif-containing protein [Corallococcus exiguus]